MHPLKRSGEIFERASKIVPGGVNSPVRAFKAVGGAPPIIRSARGARLTDVDGNQYLDFLSSWGPMILGHSHPEVVSAIQEAAERGTSYGASTELELLLAEKICAFFPSIECVRLVSSGTEATMSALRLARGFTGRPMVVKFDGCYHGHVDSLLVKAGSGVATLGIPGTPGIPAEFTAHTVSVPFNDLSALEAVFEHHAGKIAAVILEPVPANMGVVPPVAGFLEGVLRLTEKDGSLAIFDEVITGFRLALGGAQEKYGLSAPLTCLGKIVGGGLPIGAYGGKREIMKMMAPEGPVYQAGTLSGNPLAVTAGLKTLEILEREKPYERLEKLTQRLAGGLADQAKQAGVALQVQQCASLLTPFFATSPVNNFHDALNADTTRFASFFRGMLNAGVYLAPSQFEATFVSMAHTQADIDDVVSKAGEVLRKLGK
ncbi:MAG: glutamate-1-semialdehyde-2,1-aminomutase [Acidobacteria bacterium]|nr:MAG: glutamate-1-semialdehyde-2,1-aminomutase [Acidobacteriota bacterium]